MDTARYYAALLLIVTLPPAILFWFSIHPFIGFWRRRGTRFTYIVHAAGFLAVCGVLFRARHPLLAVDYGTRWPLVGLGAVLYALAIVVERLCRRHLSLRMLVGIPELRYESEGPGKLLRQGIYARVRHPRYLGVMLGSAAVACFANYRAGWLAVLLMVPALYLLTVVEERELVARFGSDYARYREQVPRFFPRLGPPRATA